MNNKEITTQPAGQPVAQPVKPAKKFLVALVALAVVLVVLLLAVVGGLKVKSGSKAKAPVPSTTTPTTASAAPSIQTSGPTVEQKELLLGACYCGCREKGGSVGGCLEKCIPCESKECKEGRKEEKKITKKKVIPSPAPAAPAAPPVQVQQPTQPPTTASRSCEGPSPTLGPEVAGLKVKGNLVAWDDPCYDRLVLYGKPGGNFPLILFSAPSHRVVLPAEYLKAGYDRFSLRTPDGRWALIHAGSKGACGVINEGARGHAYKLCK